MSLSQTPPDIIRKIAQDRSLHLSDIRNLCKTNMWLNEVICDNDRFWLEIGRERITRRSKGMKPEVIRDVLRKIASHDDDEVRRDFAKEMLDAGYERVFLNFPEESPVRETFINESPLYTRTALRMLPLMTPDEHYSFLQALFFMWWEGTSEDFHSLVMSAFTFRDDVVEIAEDFLGILLDEINVNDNDSMLELRVKALLPYVDHKLIKRTFRKLLSGVYGDENNVVAFTNALREYLGK